VVELLTVDAVPPYRSLELLPGEAFVVSGPALAGNVRKDTMARDRQPAERIEPAYSRTRYR
jgi:hypothetical protein